MRNFAKFGDTTLPAAGSVILFGQSGAAHAFTIFNVPFDGKLSACGRVRLSPHRDHDDDIVPGQYAVTYRGKPVPDNRFALSLPRDKSKRPAFARS